MIRPAADAASNLVRTDPAEAERMLADVRAELRGALDGVRRVVYGLRPIELDDLGLAGALRQKVAAMNDARGSRPEIRLQLPDELPPLSAAVKLAAYRIVLEALANVARHSTARHSDVRITAAEELGGTATAGPTEQGWRVQAGLPLPPAP